MSEEETKEELTERILNVMWTIHGPSVRFKARQLGSLALMIDSTAFWDTAGIPVNDTQKRIMQEWWDEHPDVTAEEFKTICSLYKQGLSFLKAYESMKALRS